MLSQQWNPFRASGLSSLNVASQLTKVALKKVSSFRIFSTHPESNQFHEPLRSCERSVPPHIENPFGAQTQSSLNVTSKSTKVALKKVFRFRIFSTHLESSQFHERRQSQIGYPPHKMQKLTGNNEIKFGACMARLVGVNADQSCIVARLGRGRPS